MPRACSAVRPVLLALALALVFPVGDLSAQRTWIVTPNGSFDVFNSVMRQVNHRDTVIVRAGSYDPGTYDKGVLVLCDPGVTFGRPQRNIAFALQLIPRNETFRMIGGEVTTGIHVGRCAGTVMFEGLRVAGAVVASDEDVRLTACRLGPTLVSDSTASFFECQLGGRDLHSLGGGALVVRDNATVVVSGGSLAGVDATPTLPAQPGVLLLAGELTVAGQCLIKGGVPTAPAIGTASGVLRLGHSVWLQSSIGPPVTGPAAVVRDHYPFVVTAAVDPGQTMQIRTGAEPGSLVWTVASLPSPLVRTPFGLLFVDLSTGIVLDRGVVPASGFRGTVVRTPVGFTGIRVSIQVVSATTAGRLLLGPPASFVLR